MISGKVISFIVYGENVCHKLKDIVGDKKPDFLSFLRGDGVTIYGI